MARATGIVQPQAGPIVATTLVLSDRSPPGTVITQPIADTNTPPISRALDHDGASLGAPSSYASPRPRGTTCGQRMCARFLLMCMCQIGFIGIFTVSRGVAYVVQGSPVTGLIITGSVIIALSVIGCRYAAILLCFLPKQGIVVLYERAALQEQLRIRKDPPPNDCGCTAEEYNEADQCPLCPLRGGDNPNRLLSAIIYGAPGDKDEVTLLVTTERADLNQRYMENYIISTFCLLPIILALHVFFLFTLLLCFGCEAAPPFRDFTWWSKTPLHYAIMTGDASMVAHLIELGADRNSKAYFLGCCCGKTPAQWVKSSAAKVRPESRRAILEALAVSSPSGSGATESLIAPL